MKPNGVEWRFGPASRLLRDRSSQGKQSFHRQFVCTTPPRGLLLSSQCRGDLRMSFTNRTILITAGSRDHGSGRHTTDPVLVVVAERAIATNQIAPIRLSAARLWERQAQPHAALIAVSSCLRPPIQSVPQPWPRATFGRKPCVTICAIRRCMPVRARRPKVSEHRTIPSNS